MAPPPPEAKASLTLPSLYRVLLLYFEPLFALGGVMLVLLNPGHYVSTMSRAAVTALDHDTSFIYTQLAAGWLHFAFTEAVVLRFVDDLRVWRLLSMGMLLSDLAYCHSCAQAVGGWVAWVNLANWTPDDWIAAITTYPFVLTRCAIVLGIGMRPVSKEARKTAEQ